MFLYSGPWKGIERSKIIPTLPSSSSWGVSTPWSGTRSPVKLFVCVRGRFTPLMWDIAAGPLWARSFFFAALASVLPAAATASSIRREGRSNSCCLSVNKSNGWFVVERIGKKVFSITWKYNSWYGVIIRN